MATMKRDLKMLFESCNTYVEVFKMISTAVSKGYTVEEVNAAASWRKNRIAKDSAQQYKKLVSTEYSLNRIGMTKYLGVPVEVRNLNSPIIEFNGSGFVI